MNWILIPIWRRPELLFFTLESLSKCRGIENYGVYFMLDGGFDPANLEIIKRFPFKTYEILEMQERGGCDRSIPESMKRVSDLSDDFFMILDDDMRVSKDYLELMEYCYGHFKNDRLLSVSPIGLKNEDVELVYSILRFKGTGEMFLKQPFDKYVRPHFGEEYYSSVGLFQYTDRYFEKYFLEYGGSVLSWDGLVDRILKKNGLYSLITDVPRCHEIGFYGAHKPIVFPEYFKLSLEKKILFLDDFIKRRKVRDLYSLYKETYRDIEEDHEWKDLVLEGSLNESDIGRENQI